MPTNAEFLSPVLALVAWTLVMWIWMYATRIPAMNAAGIDPQEAAYPGTWSHRLKSGRALGGGQLQPPARAADDLLRADVLRGA